MCLSYSYSFVLGRQNVTGCTPCPSTSFCSGTGRVAISGQCSQGYYCIASASTSTPTDGVTGNACSAGNYCPASSALPTPCPIATINTLTGKSSIASCVPCPASSYCLGVGLSTPTGSCSAGFYCSGNATTPAPIDGVTGNVCPIAAYCPAGASVATPCAQGSFQNVSGQSACISVPAGSYSGNGYSSPSTCPIGAYCQAGSNLSYSLCPLGAYHSKHCSTLDYGLFVSSHSFSIDSKFHSKMRHQAPLVT